MCSDGVTTTNPLAVANTFFFMLNLPNPSPLLPEAAERKEQHSVTMGTSLTSHAPFYNAGVVTCVITVLIIEIMRFRTAAKQLQLQCNSHKMITGNDSTMQSFPMPLPSVQHMVACG